MHQIARSKMMTVALAVLSFWFFILALASGVRRHGSGEELSALELRVNDERRENERVAQEIERMHQPQWLALLARQRLNYRYPDETVVFVYKSEKSGTIPPSNAATDDSRPNWQKWFDWLRGM